MEKMGSLHIPASSALRKKGLQGSSVCLRDFTSKLRTTAYHCGISIVWQECSNTNRHASKMCPVLIAVSKHDHALTNVQGFNT